MSPTKTHITGIRTVSIPVENQDAALGDGLMSRPCSRYVY